MATDNEKEWTIMVYMAGDNNLSENMAFSLEDLRTTAESMDRNSQSKVNLLAYFDSNSLTAPTHYIDYSTGTAERHEIEKRDIVHPTKRDKRKLSDGENSASAYSIINFVHWCIKTQKRTAKNYVLIFSAHSFGFHGTSFLRDESSGGFMTLFKFRWALEESKRLYFGNQKIAILGFDSCVMSMLEIGYELNKVAQTIVASEGSLPNSGWGYAPMLKKFVSNFDEDQINKWNGEEGFLEWKKTGDYVKEAAKGFVTTFIAQQKKLALGGRSVDIAAWDLEEVVPLAKKVNKLGIEFNKYLYLVDKVQNDDLTNEDISVYQELKKIILQSHYDSQTYMKEQCVDLKDFCKQMIIECKFMENGANGKTFSKLKNECKEIIVSVDKCVLKSGFSGDEYQFSNGISLYFPWSHITFNLTKFRYRYLLFARGKGNYTDLDNPKGIGKDWYNFLFNYLTRITLRLARKRKDERGNERVSVLDNFSRNNPIWDKDNPIWSKDNPFWNKDNPDANRDNPVVSRDNPDANRDNPDANRDNPDANRGEIGDYLFYFSRFKNMQMRWDISGFAEEFVFDKDFDSE